MGIMRVREFSKVKFCISVNVPFHVVTFITLHAHRIMRFFFSCFITTLICNIWKSGLGGRLVEAAPIQLRLRRALILGAYPLEKKQRPTRLPPPSRASRGQSSLPLLVLPPPSTPLWGDMG